MPDELLDIFDDNMRHLGAAPRNEVHEKGLWHQTFHCWLIRREAGKIFVVFQRRGPDKKVFPNALDITAAGHLVAGESPIDGLRELREELGIDASKDDLVPLGIRCDVAIIGSIINREFCHTYLLECKIPLDSLILQADEVTGLVEMELTEGLDFFCDKRTTARVVGYNIDATGKKHFLDIQISKNDIIPRLDPYYLKIFIMAERFFQGLKSVGI